MAYVVAIISPGEMGSAVAARLSERGIRVTTSLVGRSPASAARAQRAHMVPVVDDDALVEGADFFLSICPPGEAIALAQRLKPALAGADAGANETDLRGLQRRLARDRNGDRDRAGIHRLPIRRRRHHRSATAAERDRNPNLRFGCSRP